MRRADPLRGARPAGRLDAGDRSLARPPCSAGVTDQVELVRPDGADILIHLSTEAEPKGSSTVTAPRVPLTVDQLVGFVTSDRW